MHSTKSIHSVEQLRKRWTNKALLSYLLLALAATLFTFALIHLFIAIPLYAVLPILFFALLVMAFIARRSRLSNADVSRFLNLNIPSLEESAELALKPSHELNMLERLQKNKVEHELQLAKGLDPIKKQFIFSLVVLALATAISFAFFKLSSFSGDRASGTAATRVSAVNTVPEKILPEIRSANIIITPPAYTGKGLRQQSRFNLMAEEGAIVVWQIETNIQAKNVQLIFNDGVVVPLSNASGQTKWRTQKQVSKTGFYQVKIDDQVSELYKIETIRDKAPVISIQSPKPTTLIRYEGAQTVLLSGLIRDDYGLRQTFISATISTGQGEGVKFKEQKLAFSSFRAGLREFQMQRSIECKALGMHPGDELYFFISATDNKGQETRSDVYILTLQDTSSQASMSGLVTPLDVKTELFRSQRQIIIETEELLKDKPRMSLEAFTNKSNELGIDQKLLRMRYGKFLGEETDVEIGEAHQHEEGEEAGNETEDIIKQYSHLHDNAEDATFFDAETKRQLKATLTEMWNAETKLRMILPKEALPFEYKALRLLKDLQQKSRVFVAKTGLKTTPLNLDKRFTGDLSKVVQPVKRESIQKPEAAASTIRRALGLLEELKIQGDIKDAAKETLQKAFYQLSTRAAAEPSLYIPALSSLRNILSEKFRLKDINQAQQGLQRMSAEVQTLPFSSSNTTMSLSKQYFINLKKAGKQ